jgi:hypothetical protein
MNKKIKHKLSALRMLMPYILPYKWAYLSAVFMVAITCVVLAIMPSVEGGITSALAEDVMAQRAIRFDVVLKYREDIGTGYRDFLFDQCDSKCDV